MALVAPTTMTGPRTAKAAHLDALRSRFDRFHLHLADEARTGARVPFDAMTSEDSAYLKSCLARQGLRTDGPDDRLDDKTRGSYLIEHMADRLAYALAALTLDRCYNLGGGLCGLFFQVREEPWSHEEPGGKRMTGVGLYVDPVVQPDMLIETAEWSDEDRVALCRRILLAVFAPLIARLKALTGLAANAQWRIVADMAAGAFLYAAKEIGEAKRGMALGRLLIDGEGSPLRNRQVGYLHVAADDDPGPAQDEGWFLERGGCCRWYTTQDPADYCPTCVLLKREQRVENLIHYLEERRASKASS